MDKIGKQFYLFPFQKCIITNRMLRRLPTNWIS